MRALRRTVFLVCLALGLIVSLPLLAEELDGSEWRPTEIGDIAVSEDADIFLRFEEGGQVSGHSGCNGFFGSYKVVDDTVKVGPLGATRMACAEPVMDLELLFMRTLESARRIERQGTELILKDETGAPIALFVQSDWD